jgi:Fe-S cluster biogenesis protein NfuA/nitrite reductase/ring-hydroxylating ferredoxin subunit
MVWDDQRARNQIVRLEGLLGELESLVDPVSRTKAMETVEALVDLYGEVLARTMDRVQRSTDPGLAEALAGDELIAHLLAVHDLHLANVETRVRQALKSVRPHLRSYGFTIEMLGIDAGVLRLRLQGSVDGCGSTVAALKQDIGDAICLMVPELETVIETDGEAFGSEVFPSGAFSSGLIPPDSLLRRSDQGKEEAAAPEPEVLDLWAVAGEVPQLEGDAILLREVLGEPLLLMKLGDDLSAYRSACPGCGESLDQATMRDQTTLDASELACPACGRRYDLHQKGRCVDTPQLCLEPIPLLVADTGVVKVAVAAGRSFTP